MVSECGGGSHKTHYFKPWKLLDMKLSLGPKEKNDVLLVVVMLKCYWTELLMTSCNCSFVTSSPRDVANHLLHSNLNK
jgi:hypothetical protein